MTEPCFEGLEALLQRHSGPLAVAVSGGVDSLSLMAVAARLLGARVRAVHAVSPAVPAEATVRVRELALQRGWALRVLGAGEFDDPRYLANPVNRCYYCKSNLFNAMTAALPDAIVATGTNTDDLQDFRPGLEAARERGVWQPLVEAGIDKAAVRRLARRERLPEVAELPAQPCLSSRIETGIPVCADDLEFVHRLEAELTRRLGPGDHRCRITRRGVVAQTAFEHPLLRETAARETLHDALRALCTASGREFAALEPYRRGSAFLVAAPHPVRP
jgi:uncharacterized protein